MSRDIDRRTFLQYSGATAATAASVGLAGCGGNGNGNGNGNGVWVGEELDALVTDAD
ncbi:MAG: twin-arginine translocation signal domain-containing protein, partial [Natronomonas sp.]